MADLSAFPITTRWPAKDPSVIQLYSFPTPNGVKVSIALEEMGLAYEPHLVTLKDEDVRSEAFLSLNPNNKIPAIIDPNGPEGPVGIFESGAILLYLAEKSGKFLGKNATDKAKITQWLMFQMGGLGPMLGQMGYFYKFAGSQGRRSKTPARGNATAMKPFGCWPSWKKNSKAKTGLLVTFQSPTWRLHLGSTRWNTTAPRMPWVMTTLRTSPHM